MEQELQAASFERAASAYASAVGGSMSGDSVRRITEGEGAKILAMRTQDAEHAQTVFELGQAGTRDWEQHSQIVAVAPIVDRASVSTDGVMIRIRGEDWKEVKITAFSRVSPSPRPNDQITRQHPAHEPVITLSAHSYQAVLDDADTMLKWQLAEGFGRGIFQCPVVTSPNDGAAWIERITRTNFPHAVQIVDWAHASQHIYAAAKLTWPGQSDTAQAWSHTQLDKLWSGQTQVVAATMSHLASPEAAKSASYFADNLERMRYPDFRAQGRPIGSGTVESAAKTVIQHRLKRPCRGWNRDNASAMIAALTEFHSDRLDLVRHAYCAC